MIVSKATEEKIIFLYWIMSVNLMMTVCGSSEVCRNLESTKNHFDLSIVSRKTISGVWKTYFTVNRDVLNDTQNVLLDLKQEVHQCGSRQILSIHGKLSDTPQDEDGDNLVFLSKTGKNVAITNNGRTVQKINAEDRLNSVVFTNRPLKKGEMFQLRADSRTPKLGYIIGIGVTTLSPYDIEIPPHINNLRGGGTWVLYHDHVYSNGSLLGKGNTKNIDKIEVGDRVGIKRSESGALHLYINGIDEGPVASNLPEILYGVFEIYGDMGKYTLLS